MNPNNQDIMNYLGGVFSNPNIIAPQLPSSGVGIGGASNVYTQPTGGYTPYNNQQLQAINGFMKQVPNSSTNHSTSNGGWNSSFNPGYSQLGSQGSMGSQYAL